MGLYPHMHMRSLHECRVGVNDGRKLKNEVRESSAHFMEISPVHSKANNRIYKDRERMIT